MKNTQLSLEIIIWGKGGTKINKTIENKSYNEIILNLTISIVTLNINITS